MQCCSLTSMLWFSLMLADNIVSCAAAVLAAEALGEVGPCPLDLGGLAASLWILNLRVAPRDNDAMIGRMPSTVRRSARQEGWRLELHSERACYDCCCNHLSKVPPASQKQTQTYRTV